MKPHWKHFAIVCLLAGALAACETLPPPKPVTRPEQELTLAEILPALKQRQEAIQNVKSLVKTRVATQEDNHSFKQVLVIDGETSLRMDTLSLFNQPLGVLISRDGGILLYDTDSQKMYRDAEVWDIMVRIFGTVFDFREYINVFSGKIPRFDSLDMKSMEWNPETGHYHIHAADPGQGVALEIEVDPETLRPTRLVKSRGDQVFYQAAWEDYRMIGEIPFPFKISVKRPSRGDSLVMKFNEPVLNQGVPADTFELNVPESG